jgi:hypothetical protein
MTIKNDTQLMADNASLFADNNAGDITPLDLRTYNDDLIDSVRPYSSVISGGSVAAYEVTPTPVKLATFDAAPISENDLFLADFANDQIEIKSACNIFCTIKINGEWAATEDLQIDVYVNGAANPITPISLIQKGEGTGNPVAISSALNTFVITAGDLAVGGGTAKIALFASNAAAGSFDLDQITATFGIQYISFSIS